MKPVQACFASVVGICGLWTDTLSGTFFDSSRSIPTSILNFPACDAIVLVAAVMNSTVSLWQNDTNQKTLLSLLGTEEYLRCYWKWELMDEQKLSFTHCASLDSSNYTRIQEEFLESSG